MQKQRAKPEQTIMEGPDGERWVYRLKLPKLTYFRAGERSKQSPLVKFHFWVADQLGGLPKGLRINPSAVWLAGTDAEQLRSLLKTWVRTQLPYATAKRLDSEVELLNLEFGPAMFWYTRPEWLVPGYVYVKEDLFVESTKEVA